MKKRKRKTFKATIPIRLDQSEKDLLERLAEEDSRPLSSYCRLVLAKHLEAVKNRV